MLWSDYAAKTMDICTIRKKQGGWGHWDVYVTSQQSL